MTSTQSSVVISSCGLNPSKWSSSQDVQEDPVVIQGDGGHSAKGEASVNVKIYKLI